MPALHCTVQGDMIRTLLNFCQPEEQHFLFPWCQFKTNALTSVHLVLGNVP